jgi:hypothetical protein
MSLAAATFPAVCPQGERPAVGFRPLAGRGAIRRVRRLAEGVVRRLGEQSQHFADPNP